MSIELNLRVYRYLLRLCPREFHHRFAEEMLGVFEDALREEVRERGRRRSIVLSCSAYCDLIHVAARLRLRDMPLAAAALSIMVSSALFLALFRAVS